MLTLGGYQINNKRRAWARQTVWSRAIWNANLLKGSADVGKSGLTLSLPPHTRTHTTYTCKSWFRDLTRFYLWSVLGQKLGEGVKGVYISIDVDCLDPAFAPGVSHIEPGGLSFRDVLNILHNLQADVVAADVVEFNPQRDTVDGMTGMVAAKLVRELAAKISKWCYSSLLRCSKANKSLLSTHKVWASGPKIPSHKIFHPLFKGITGGIAEHWPSSEISVSCHSSSLVATKFW